MTIRRFQQLSRPWILLLLAGLAIGLISAASLKIVLSASLAGAALVGAFGLLVAPRWVWRVTWIALLAASAFGAFLDIVTHQPIDLLIGVSAPALLGILSIRVIIFKLWRSDAGSLLHITPAVAVFVAYIAYLILESLRPDVNNLVGLISLRLPLIGLGAYFLTRYAFDDTDLSRTLAHVFQLLCLIVIIGIIVSSYGLFQFVVGFDRLQAWRLVEPSGLYFQNELGITIFRIFGTLRRNEVLGIFLFIVIVAAAAAMRLGLRPKWLGALAIGLSLVTLLLTYSLISVFTVGVWIVLNLWHLRSRRVFVRLGLLAGVGLAVVLTTNYALGGLIWTRLKDHFITADWSGSRQSVTRNWILEISERPPLEGMFGSGLCTAINPGDDTLNRIQGILDLRSLSATVTCGWVREIHDNWYATHSLEVGWVGLILVWGIFALLELHTIPRATRRWRSPVREAWQFLGLGVVALWPAGFVSYVAWSMPIVLFFWCFVGIMDSMARAGPNTPVWPPVRQKVLRKTDV